MKKETVNHNTPNQKQKKNPGSKQKSNINLDSITTTTNSYINYKKLNHVLQQLYKKANINILIFRKSMQMGGEENHQY